MKVKKYKEFLSTEIYLLVYGFRVEINVLNIYRWNIAYKKEKYTWDSQNFIKNHKDSTSRRAVQSIVWAIASTHKVKVNDIRYIRFLFIHMSVEPMHSFLRESAITLSIKSARISIFYILDQSCDLKSFLAENWG